MASRLAHPPLSQSEQFQTIQAREESLDKLLIAFITTGLLFMVFRGTFLGVWNLLQISGRESDTSISPAWVPAEFQIVPAQRSARAAAGECSRPLVARRRNISASSVWLYGAAQQREPQPGKRVGPERQL